jgi:hypothetical protein
MVPGLWTERLPRAKWPNHSASMLSVGNKQPHLFIVAPLCVDLTLSSEPSLPVTRTFILPEITIRTPAYDSVFMQPGIPTASTFLSFTEDREMKL